ncbi:MAG: polyprenyl diphosphate synthase [Spirochaetes bacterium]|nr:polyprenyl diphosphate synthase [Spirochaetota bacterium]
MKSDKKLQHISFIMDGNGRWAKKRLLPRTAGHSAGVKKAKEITLYIKEKGIPFLSLYTFSKENWRRSADEVNFLMQLIVQHFKDEFDFYKKNGIRVIHIGDRAGVPADVLAAIDQVAEETSHFRDLTVMPIFNYSGKYDIVQAVNQIIKSSQKEINEEQFSQYLLTSQFPDPDLIVRTSGEFRISNYFLWQAAYSEFYITDKLWPDLSKKDVDLAIENFYKRDRRFGGVKNEKSD